MSADRTLYYEDLAYGAAFESGLRRVTEEDLEAFAEVSGDRNPIHVDPEYAAGTAFGQRVVHGPFGIALAMGFFHEMGILERSALALLDVKWSFEAPIFIGDELRMRMTVTGRRLTSKGDTGLIGRHVEINKSDGSVAQQGSMGLLAKVRDPEAAAGADAETPAPGTVAWGRKVAERLEGLEAFAEAARPFDGAIGLGFGDDEVAFKLYGGRVLDVARRLPNGTTFTVRAEPRDWVELLGRERNDFMPLASSGRFSVSGNVHEYLRMTRALMELLDAARAVTPFAQERREG